ncbi:MAG: hypothetical protein Kow0079_17280 [Vicingaceae bacterium]
MTNDKAALKKQKELEKLHLQLKSKNKDEVLSAINKLREKGQPSSINALLNLYESTNSEEVKKTIQDFLLDVKADNVADFIIEHIKTTNDPVFKNFLISLFWQTRLDATPYFNDLISLAIEADYLTTLEVLTVVENLNINEIDEQAIDFAVQELHYAYNEEDNVDKKNLMLSIIEIFHPNFNI